ncbi:hypothetical protein BCR35DRAFT_296003 [Leucosporidium creatinivorum]|uniref:C2H2-type domain-containing protein n=1 Tax=Leucosporidium creatinivorum TaxID=106004 RepID=A0A1Y2DEM6_9BASI|nr:hypothetical protein BCR35DRAFT_296003 [Leucosporidium creatinivorum]
MPRQYNHYGEPICEDCNRAFVNDRALDQHYLSSSCHSWCQQCDRDFVSDAARRSHWANSSLHDFCTLCDSHFDCWQDLEDHEDEEHSRCSECSQLFAGPVGLHEHSRQSHARLYCTDCRRMFRNQNEWTGHRNSSLHRPATVPCPSIKFGGNCTRKFGSIADAVLHLEAGTCSSGMDRRKVDRYVLSHDRTNIITNPNQRLIGYTQDNSPPPRYHATSEAWSHRYQAYYCVLCPPAPNPRLFKNTSALNQHLNSSKHVYANQGNADKLYRCPNRDCGHQFALFSALVQHLERGSCFQQLYRVQQTIGW